MRWNKELAFIFVGLLGGCNQPNPGGAMGKDLDTYPPSSFALPKGDLRLDNLLAYAGAIRDFKPTSNFQKSPNQSDLIGRRFVVELRYDLAGRYDADKEEAQIFLFTDCITEDCSLHDGVTIFEKSIVGAKVARHNAFGAEVDVTPVAERKIVLVAGTPNKPLGIFSEHPQLEKTLKMSPDEARQKLADVKIIYEGRIGHKNDFDNSPVTCGEHTTEAKFDRPQETVTDYCEIGAQLDRIAVVSPKAGTLAEWTAEGLRR